MWIHLWLFYFILFYFHGKFRVNLTITVYQCHCQPCYLLISRPIVANTSKRPGKIIYTMQSVRTQGAVSDLGEQNILQ